MVDRRHHHLYRARLAGLLALSTACAGAVAVTSASAEPKPDGGGSGAAAYVPRAAVPLDAAAAPRHSGQAGPRAGAPAAPAEPGAKDIPIGKWRGQAYLDADDIADNTRDIRSVDAYTRPQAGRMLAVTKFQAAPTKANTSIAIYFGTLKQSTCTGRALIVGPTKGGKGQWATFTSGGQVSASGSARVTAIGRRILVDAQSPKLKTKYQCSFARSASDNGQTTYDRTGAIRMESVPQVLYSLITATPEHTGFVPGTSKSLVTKYSEDLDVDYLDPVRDVYARFTPGAGVRVDKRLVKVGNVDYGDEKPARVTARPTGSKQTTVRVTAAGDYGVDEFSYVLHPLGKPLSFGSSLVGKRMFAKEDCYTPGGSSFCENAHTLWFVTKNKVFVAGSGGGPLTSRPTCKSGCKTYSYQPKANKIVIGGQAGTIKGRSFTWSGNTYRPMSSPAAGARWQTFKTSVFGAVDVGIGYDYLLLYANGTFSTYTNFYPAGATTPSREVPDEVAAQRPQDGIQEGRGTYQVLKGGVIRFSYKNGKKLTRTIGVETGADGRTNPWDVGLVLSRTDYNTYDCLGC